MNKEFKGVRTYFFNAHHWRGVPEMLISKENLNLDYDDWAWVPKR